MGRFWKALKHDLALALSPETYDDLYERLRMMRLDRDVQAKWGETSNTNLQFERQRRDAKHAQLLQLADQMTHAPWSKRYAYEYAPALVAIITDGDPAAEFLLRCVTCQVNYSPHATHDECYRVADGGDECCCTLIPTKEAADD